MRPALLLVLLLAFTCEPSQAQLVGPGDLAFIGFNADGDDDFAVVLLAEAAAGTVVRFTDNEWEGSAFNSGEGAVAWTLSEALTAGTVVTFSNIDAAGNTGFGASRGTLSGPLQLAAGGETLYAYLGMNSTTPSSFLAAISTLASDFNTPPRTLNGTGLTQGSTAVLLPNGTRGGKYTGPRTDKETFDAYVPAIGAVGTHWATSTTNGTTMLPFSTARFETVATPEPGAGLLALIAGLGVLARRWR